MVDSRSSAAPEDALGLRARSTAGPGRPSHRPSRGAFALRGVALAVALAAILVPTVREADLPRRSDSAGDGAAQPAGEPPLHLPALAAPVGPLLRSPGPAARGPPTGDGSPAPGAPAVTGLPATAFPALAPGAVRDAIAPAAHDPIPIRRQDLLGTAGAEGTRRAPPPDRVRWTGMAGIRRDGSTDVLAADDTRDPATTAVRGTVVAEDGSPVVGAEVILYSSFYLRQAYYDHRVRQIGRTWTDADGVFDLRPVALDTVHFGRDGEVFVTVRHAVRADLVGQPLSGIVPGQESDVGRLVLPVRAATVHGVVRDVEGRPVADAVVRVSGQVNPVRYDKTERMVVLDDCPSAVTDAQGRYALTDFAAGVHEVSIHVRLDCVLHVRERWEGERAWNPVVLPGNSVRGRVVDPDGNGVEAAVVAGGQNWTPTNPDGTFWLDNVFAGPLALEVAHHDWRTLQVAGVATNGDDVTLRFERRLPRVTLRVTGSDGAPAPLVAIDWIWREGGGPGRFAPESRFWHDEEGVFRVTVPDGTTGAIVTDASGGTATLGGEDLVDGADRAVGLAPPPLEPR